MLISKVSEDESGLPVGGRCDTVLEDNSNEYYHTANELFELMSRNENLNTNNGATLTAGDLVLLYKNIDVDTKISVNEFKLRKPNQHVETIIYHDELDSEGSDVSDVFSAEDIQNVYMINNERLDLLDSPPSIENTLCHKFANIGLLTTATNEYDKYFLFKDPYIKEQLKSFDVFSSNAGESNIFPSFLDYVCCKRLEDNYNFYMDNVILYVKNTIDQLKRISNGDYLTDKVKEKWKKVEHIDETPLINTKVLATSTSIPLHVERKTGRRKSMWDEIVHSEVDVRSLSKILEKEIILQVPKLLSGSYELLSKYCDDNLVISCKKKRPVAESNESRLDVVFQLKRSEKGHVISNISSIMILQTAPAAPIPQAIELPDAQPVNHPLNSSLPLMYKEIYDDAKNVHESNVKIVELESSTDDFRETVDCASSDPSSEEIYSDSLDFRLPRDNLNVTFDTSDIQEDKNDFDDALNLEPTPRYTQKEASFDVCPDDLRMTIQRLTIQTPVPEEITEDASQLTVLKKKSPTRVRIKSPYENKSFVIEEKKRRKLLEIRERRERRKMALAENCKITKHKYAKGTVMPQTSSSVTKLSITNKSFYNSIYGQTINADAKQTKNRHRKDNSRKETLDIGLENIDNEQETPRSLESSQKFINRSYYLDDAVSEMMYLKIKRQETEKEPSSASTSCVSSDFRTNLNILSQLMDPHDSEINYRSDDNDEKSPIKLLQTLDESSEPECRTKEIGLTQSTFNLSAPVNSPKSPKRSSTKPENYQKSLSVECRKSIDKIYQLIKKEKPHDLDSMYPHKLSTDSNRTDITAGKESSSLQDSDSGTSLKHHLSSSNRSNFSSSKTNNTGPSGLSNKKPSSPINVIPKVIISSKSVPGSKTETDPNKRDQKVVISSTDKEQKNNPLKAISQLLHEFENVQKSRLRSASDKTKKPDTTIIDGKTSARPINIKRRSRFEQHDEAIEKRSRVPTPREKKARPVQEMNVQSIPYQQVPIDNKYGEKNAKKKITDIIDEAKEARGEAVRGPPKFYSSRLNSLAQPKRSYVQAHSEEYQTRYGRNIITDRLQRLVAGAPAPVAERTTGASNFKNKRKKNSNDAVSAVSLKLPTQSGLPIDISERAAKRRSNCSSPDSLARERISSWVGSPFKQSNVPDTPEILKKKMVAVESYVKSHYGSGSPVSNVSIQKSRTPLLPDDFDLGSPQSSSPSSPPKKSTEVGSKLHYMIDSMIKSNTHGLEVLTEFNESQSRSSKENTNTENLIYIENLKCDRTSIASDYTLGTVDDGTVLTSNDNSDVSKEPKHTNQLEADCKMHDVQPFKSATELEVFEHALSRPLSVGAFSKRLQVNKMTLTPKQSIQKIFLLQSGDAGALVVKASLSQNSQTEKLLDFKAMPILSKSHLDVSLTNIPVQSSSRMLTSHLNWTFTKIPMQMATVGYVLPEYESVQCGSHSTGLLEKVSKRSFGRDSPNSRDSAENSSPAQQSSPNKSSPTFRSSNTWSQRGSPTCRFQTIRPSSVGKNSVTDRLSDKSLPVRQDLIDNSSLIRPSSIDKTSPFRHIISRYCSSDKSHKDSQCNKGGQTIMSKMEQAAQVDIANFGSTPKMLNCNKIVVTKTACELNKDVTKHVTKTAQDLSKDIATHVKDEKGENKPANITPMKENKTDLNRIDPDGVDYTTSLDILVGLLSEIQKITTCQTNMTQTETEKYKELETILNKSAEMKISSPCNVLSISSLEKLRGLESNPSVFSFCVSDSDGANKRREFSFNSGVNEWYNTKKFSGPDKPMFADKEITVDFASKEYVNKLTDVPSIFFPIMRNNSTNKTNSFLGGDSESSSHSIFSLTDYHSTFSNASLNSIKSSEKIIEIQEITKQEPDKLLVCYANQNQNVNKTNAVKLLHISRTSENTENIEKSVKSVRNKHAIEHAGFDPVLKMKRDILVTMYSMLVLTVFAALSFPEMMYYV